MLKPCQDFFLTVQARISFFTGVLIGVWQAASAGLCFTSKPNKDFSILTLDGPTLDLGVNGDLWKGLAGVSEDKTVQ